MTPNRDTLRDIVSRFVLYCTHRLNGLMRINKKVTKGMTPPDRVLVEALRVLVQKPKRRRISDKKRAAILARDGHACFYCGSKDDLQVDHIVAFSGQGSDDDSNLVAACGKCNRAKRAQSASGFQTRQLDRRLNP